eukprot:gene5630-11362_t
MESGGDILRIKVREIRAEGLKSAELFGGKNDTYAILTLGGGFHDNWKIRTSTKEDSGSSAVWDLRENDPTSWITISNSNALASSLCVSFMDENSFRSDAFIGEGKVNLSVFLSACATTKNVELPVHLVDHKGQPAGSAAIVLHLKSEDEYLVDNPPTSVTKAELEAAAKKEAEDKAKAESEAAAKKEAEDKAKAESEAAAKKEAEDKAKAESEAAVKKEAEDKAKAESEAAAKKEAEDKAKADASKAIARKEVESKGVEDMSSESISIYTVSDESPPLPDAFLLRKSATSSKSIEITEMFGNTGYRNRSQIMRSALHETESTYHFGFGASHDLVMIKSTGTGSHFTEINVLSALRNYQTYSMQESSVFPEADGSYAFAVASNSDVFVIKRKGTASGKIELSVLSAGSSYKSVTIRAVIPFEIVPGSLVSFAVAPNHDLFVIQQSGTQSNCTEISVFTVASNYEKIILHSPTSLEETDSSYEFSVAQNNDIFVIKKMNTASKMTEISVLTTASYYQSFSLHNVSTGLHQTDHVFTFAIGIRNELLAVKRFGTVSRKVEVLQLHPSSNYSSITQTMKTAIFQTTSSFAFCIKDNKDIIAISKMGNMSKFTEVHILSNESNYQTFIRRGETCLHETDLHYKFCIAKDGDLFAICRRGETSKKTDVIILSAESNYGTIVLNTATALEECDHTVYFALASNRDLFVFKKSNTKSNTTEIHVLSEESKYKSFILQTSTALKETDESFSFTVLENRDVLVLRRANTASGFTEFFMLLASSGYKMRTKDFVSVLPEVDDSHEFLFV